MNRIATLLLALLLTGCDKGRDHEERVTQAIPHPIDKENACAELTSTLELEVSKRMEIAKSYGFTPKQGQLIERSWTFGEKTMREVSLEFGKDCAPVDADLSQPPFLLARWCDDIEIAVMQLECIAEVEPSCVGWLSKIKNGMTSEDFERLEKYVAECTREKLRNDPSTSMTAEEREARSIERTKDIQRQVDRIFRND